MDVSVITPVYNDEKRIVSCINSIQKQKTHFTYEIIVVNDCSTDRSALFLKNFDNIALLRNSENRGQSYSRNLGASVAKGKYIFFVDSDVVVPENAISDAISYMNSGIDSSIQGVQGTFKIHNHFPNWSSILYNTLQYLLTATPELSYNVNAACLFIKRDTFFNLGCFNEDIWYMEDVEFSRRAAKSRILFKRGIVFFKHKKCINFLWLFKQHFIGGIQLAYLDKYTQIKSAYSKKYANAYFINNLKKITMALLFLIAGFFYPVIFLLIPVIFATYIKTVISLYQSLENVFFILWGFVILHLISVIILIGFIYSKVFGILLKKHDRHNWLKSNYREA